MCWDTPVSGWTGGVLFTGRGSSQTFVNTRSPTDSMTPDSVTDSFPRPTHLPRSPTPYVYGIRRRRGHSGAPSETSKDFEGPPSSLSPVCPGPTGEVCTQGPGRPRGLVPLDSGSFGTKRCVLKTRHLWGQTTGGRRVRGRDLDLWEGDDPRRYDRCDDPTDGTGRRDGTAGDGTLCHDGRAWKGPGGVGFYGDETGGPCRGP